MSICRRGRPLIRVSFLYTRLTTANRAGVCGVIDASSLSPQLQILAAQARLSPPPTAVILAADTRSWTVPTHDYWQVVLIIQLVVQIKLAPFIEVKLDVVSAAAAAMLRKFLF